MQRTRCTLLALLISLVACGKPGPSEPRPSSGNGGSSAAAGTGTGALAGTTSAGSAAGGASSAGAGGSAGAVNDAGTGGSSGASAGTGGAAGTGGGPWQFPAGVSKPRLMIVGDSISAGPGCYKKYLLQNLTDNHYTQFEFVGEYNDDCGGGVKHSAVSCSTSEQYTHPTFMMPNCAQGTSFPGMATLATTHHPDLVMMQLGVNDVWGGATTEATLANYKTLVEQARAQNPSVVLVVAQIHKIRPDCGSDDSVQKRAEALVMAVPAWAQGLSTAQSPVFVADLWTNSDWSMAETNDCVHPNDVGAQRMGLNWYSALKGILKPDP